MQPAVDVNIFLTLANNTGTFDILKFKPGSQGFESITSLPATILNSFPLDFEQDADGNYIYDNTLSITTVEDLILFPDGNIYITRNEGEDISRIFGSTSNDPRYALGIATFFYPSTRNADASELVGPFNFMTGNLGIGGVKGPGGGPQGPDPDPVQAYVGCTDFAACNYDPLANVDNGSCAYPDPFLETVCGGCFSSGVGGTPYAGINNCGDCYLEGEEIINESCYVCPQGVDDGTGYIYPGCEGQDPPCYEDFSVCVIYGCGDETACNYTDLTSGVEGEPNTELNSTCTYIVGPGCDCNGATTLLPPPVPGTPVLINCTDCSEEGYTGEDIKDATHCNICSEWDRHDEYNGNIPDLIINHPSTC